MYVSTVAEPRLTTRDLRKREQCIQSHHLDLEKILKGLNGHPPPPVESMNRAVTHVCGWLGLEVRVFERFPPLLGLAPEKMDAAVMYLTQEVGLSFRALNRFPSLLGYSVQEPTQSPPNGRGVKRRKRTRALKPKVEYLRSLGINVPVFVERAPQVLGLSVAGNMKPKVQFLEEHGYNVSEQRDGRIFTYSLAERIAPRITFLHERSISVRDSLSYFLSLSDERFCTEYGGCSLREYQDFMRRMPANGRNGKHGNGRRRKMSTGNGVLAMNIK